MATKLSMSRLNSAPYSAEAAAGFAAVTAHANRALRLSPFDPVAFIAHMILGHVAVYEAHYDEAVSHYAKAVQANPRHSWLYFCHAVALALAGRVEDAGPTVRLLLELNPDFRSTRVFDYSVVGTFGGPLARRSQEKFPCD